MSTIKFPMFEGMKTLCAKFAWLTLLLAGVIVSCKKDSFITSANAFIGLSAAFDFGTSMDN